MRMSNKYVPQISDEDFKIIIKSSRNIRQALIKMGLKPKGGNYKVLINRCKTLQIDLPESEKFVIKDQSQKEIRKSVTDQEIIHFCSTLHSMRDVLCHLGLFADNNSTRQWIGKKIVKLNINIDHWLGQGHLKGKENLWASKTDINNLMDKTYTNTSNLKNRLIKEGLLINICAICNILLWQNKKLSLHLDHIDGDNTNNKLENLRLLCPNCHSLTDTYCGKNKGK